MYSGTFRLGQTTPSYDAETEPSAEQPWGHVSDGDLQEAAAKLTGDILQLPPMFSALKVKGAPVRIEPYNLNDSCPGRLGHRVPGREMSDFSHRIASGHLI